VQFSLFGAETAEPQRRDLDGLLLAGAQWVRHAGAARLSVLVEPGWRDDALREEFAGRQLPAEVVDAEGGLRAVRTGFRTDLTVEADRWTRGAGQRAPADLHLTAAGLRLWTIAAGRPDEHGGYVLGTRDAASELHSRAGAALARLGVTAIGVVRSPGWRVVGQRRVARLAELVGERPPGAGPSWPF
jgi:hypothetical protein